MGKIVVIENASIDGIVQDPTGEEGSSRGGWFGEVTDSDREAWVKVAFDEARDAAALLFGRHSYEFFAARWPSRSGPFADRLNSLPKYVVSSTLKDPDWTGSTILSGDVMREISKLKQDLDGDIVVYASFQLVQTLIERDLFDELRLTTFPFLLGDGTRLFGDMGAKRRLLLIGTETIGHNLTRVTYRPIP